MIPLWLQLIATRWHSIAFKAFLLLFGTPGSHMKPYLISMPEFASFLHSTSVQLHWRQDACTYLSLPPASWKVGLGNTPGWWCPQPPGSFSNDSRSRRNCYTHHFLWHLRVQKRSWDVLGKCALEPQHAQSLRLNLSPKHWDFPAWCSLGRLGRVLHVRASAATRATLSTELGTWSTGQGRIATPQDMDHVSCHQLHRNCYPKPDRDGSSWWLKHPLEKYESNWIISAKFCKPTTWKKKDEKTPQLLDCPIIKTERAPSYNYRYLTQKISLGIPHSRG